MPYALAVFVLGHLLAASPISDEVAQLEKRAPVAFWKDWKPVALDSPEAKPFEPIIADVLAAANKQDKSIAVKHLDSEEAMRRIEQAGDFTVADEHREYVAKLMPEEFGSFFEHVFEKKKNLYHPARLLVSPDDQDAICFFQNCVVAWQSFETTFGVILHRNGEDWKIVDLCHLNVRMCYSKNSVGIMDRRIRPMRQALLQLNSDAITAIGSGNARKLDEVFDKVHSFPDIGSLVVLKFLIVGQLLLNQGEFERASAAFYTMGTMSFDALSADYFAAMVANKMESPEKAIFFAQRFIDTIGPNASAYREIASAQEKMGQKEAAADSLRAAFAANSTRGDCLIALARLLPDDKAGEVAKLYDKSRELIPFGAMEEKLHEAQCYAAMIELAKDQRRVQPDDLQPVTYEALGLRGQRKFADAAKMIAPALSKFKNREDVDFNQSIYLHCMYEQGKLIEAFEKCPDRDLAFDNVLLSAPRMKRDELAAIIAIEAKSNPQHPGMELARANLAMHEGNDAEADRLFEDAFRKYWQAEPSEEDESALDSIFAASLASWLKTRLRLKTDETAYVLDPGNRDLFRELAIVYYEAKLAGPLAKLIEEHRQADDSDPDLVFWDGVVEELEGNNEEASVLYRRSLVKKLSHGLHYQAERFLLRTLVRIGDFPEAGALAEEWYRRSGNPFFFAIVAAGMRDADALPRLEAMLKKCADNGCPVKDFYENEVIAEALNDPRFATLREKYPEPPSEPTSSP